jgi:hypothetical protein
MDRFVKNDLTDGWQPSTINGPIRADFRLASSRHGRRAVAEKCAAQKFAVVRERMRK